VPLPYDLPTVGGIRAGAVLWSPSTWCKATRCCATSVGRASVVLLCRHPTWLLALPPPAMVLYVALPTMHPDTPLTVAGRLMVPRSARRSCCSSGSSSAGRSACAGSMAGSRSLLCSACAARWRHDASRIDARIAFGGPTLSRYLSESALSAGRASSYSRLPRSQQGAGRV